MLGPGPAQLVEEDDAPVLVGVDVDFLTAIPAFRRNGERGAVYPGHPTKEVQVLRRVTQPALVPGVAVGAAEVTVAAPAAPTVRRVIPRIAHDSVYDLAQRDNETEVVPLSWCISRVQPGKT